MRLLDLIIQEYITIVELLEQENPVENERIIIDREEFKQLLEKYGYLNFTQKTRAYEDLNFIIHDKNNYTLPCKNHTLKKTVRRVVINYRAYQTIKHLYNTDVEL